jgi:hypothetical protein
VGNSCLASSSAISDRLEGKKMSGKKMKIGSGVIATPTSFLADPFFTPHFFAINAAKKKSRQRAARFRTTGASNHFER